MNEDLKELIHLLEQIKEAYLEKSIDENIKIGKKFKYLNKELDHLIKVLETKKYKYHKIEE